MNNTGFTLIELMMVIVVSTVIMALVWTTTTMQERSYITQEQVVEIQQNLRAAINILSRDIRMAGFDPIESGNFDFVNNFTFENASASVQRTVNTDATQMAFTVDYNENGTLDRATIDANGDGVVDMGDQEQVAYRLNSNALERYSSLSGVVPWQDIASNIEAIEFNYILADGTTTTDPVATSDLPNIRTVQLSILARADKKNPKITDTDIYTFASGAQANGGSAYNDNIRRRMMIFTVQCRNMKIRDN